jgi:hypothetical protein
VRTGAADDPSAGGKTGYRRQPSGDRELAWTIECTGKTVEE